MTSIVFIYDIHYANIVGLYHTSPETLVNRALLPVRGHLKVT